MTFTHEFMQNIIQVIHQIDTKQLDNLVIKLQELREKKGRLFILGVGGSAANASHAVNDFRKLCNIDAYAPTDNVSEITARTNDEGWHSIFTGWLKVSNINQNDALLILSVGGGDVEKNISTNLVEAINLAKSIGANVYSVVGRKEGFASKKSDISIIIPNVTPENITPFSESLQAVIWHCLVSHPALKENKTKWASVVGF